jgi:hypothetical protein
MAAQGSNRPAARVLFIVPEAGAPIGDQEGGGRKDKFVEIAPAWLTERGGYRFTLDSVPAELLAGRSVTFILSPAADDSNPAPAPRQGNRR